MSQTNTEERLGRNLGTLINIRTWAGGMICMWAYFGSESNVKAKFLFLYFIFEFDAVGLSKSKEVENETKKTKANENQRVGLRSLSMTCSVSSPVKANLDLTKIFKEIKTNTTLPRKRLAATIHSIWAIHRQVMPEKVPFLSLLNISNEQLLICTL